VGLIYEHKILFKNVCDLPIGYERDKMFQKYISLINEYGRPMKTLEINSSRASQYLNRRFSLYCSERQA